MSSWARTGCAVLRDNVEKINQLMKKMKQKNTLVLTCSLVLGSSLLILVGLAERGVHFSSLARTASANISNTSVQLLRKNTVYRVGDVVHHTGIKWRRDSIAILTQRKFRRSLLWSFLASTSRYNGTRLSELSRTELHALLLRATRLEKELRDTTGESGILLEPNRRTRINALARTLKQWLHEARCTRAPPNVSVIHLRLGDKLADMTLETEEMYRLILLRDIAGLACTGDQVVLNGVMHFGPISADLQRRHPWMRHSSTFEFSAKKYARNHDFISCIRSKLASCGIQHRWRSQPNVDEDMCFLSTANHYAESLGGYSKLIKSFRTELGMDTQQLPSSHCRSRLLRCLGATAAGHASAQALPEVYRKQALGRHDVSHNLTRVAERRQLQELLPSVTHLLKDVIVTVAVWPTHRPQNMSPLCRTSMVGDTHKMLDVGVTICPRREVGLNSKPSVHSAGVQPGTKRLIAGRRKSMALCIPPLYGKLREARILKHLSFYSRQYRFRHTYVYTTVALHLGQRAETTVLSMPWAMALQLHSRAQNFMENDCVHRAAAHGLEWALSADIDEFLVFNPGATGLQGLLQRADSGELGRIKGVGGGKVVNVLTFGSVWVRYFYLDDRARNWDGTIHCSDNYRGPLNGKDDARAKVCAGHAGRRKHLVRTQQMWTVNIHHARNCRTGVVATVCSIADLSTDEARLLHIDRQRGAAQRDARASGGRYELCPTCPAVGIFRHKDDVAHHSRSPPTTPKPLHELERAAFTGIAEGESDCRNASHVWITVGSKDGQAALFGARPSFCHEHLHVPPPLAKLGSFWRTRWLLVRAYLQEHRMLRLAILTDA